MGKFEIKIEDSGKFKFDLKSRNGRVIVKSMTFPSKQDCEKGIKSLKQMCWEGDIFEKKTAGDNGLYFTVLGPNGETMAFSENYSNLSGVRNGIASVRSNAPFAEVEDLTLS